MCARLEAAGIRCWIAPRDILAATSYGEAIIDAIHALPIGCRSSTWQKTCTGATTQNWSDEQNYLGALLSWAKLFESKEEKS